MTRVAIIDDEERERETLSDAFLRLSSELGVSIEPITFDSPTIFLADYDHSYDLVCMDIDMPEQNGVSAAHRLRELDADVPLVFVTNMAQMAIRGYEVRALDFILKPVNYYSLSMKMRSILTLIDNKRTRNLVFPTADGFISIKTDEIQYVEVRGHYLFFHTDQGLIRQRGSMREWEEKLEGLPFERCNNCYLVSMPRVSSVAGDEVRVGDDWLKMSRPKKKAFLESLADYMGGVNA